jgi:integrative and conjugative element protein (TIGR02256 family)
MRPTEVLLPEVILREMEREADRWVPEETGGVLIGYQDPGDAALIQVETQIGPGPAAVHARHRFKPDAAWQEARIAAAYTESGRIFTYLGDWHSHPQGSAKPSRLDRSTARRIARSREARMSRPLIVILWGGCDDWQVAAHRGGLWRLKSAGATVIPGHDE